MSKPKRKSTSQRKRCLTAVAVLLSSAVTTAGAIASTQSFETDNPFSASIPDIISDSGGSGIVAGEPNIADFEPSLEDLMPNFPGLPGGLLPTSPGEIINGGLGGIFEGAGGQVPKIFKDVLSGNMGGLLGSIFSILTSQIEIFDEIAEVVLSDGWEGARENNEDRSLPNPYEIRLPDTEEGRAEEDNGAGGLITRSPIVLRRDLANLYDQELGRAMAAPMLAEKGDQWLKAQIATSAETMQKGLETTQSAVTKSTEATEATSTQDIVRRNAEISGIAATMQLQEMQQNARIGESLWNMQRLGSAQLQLAADISEAADEQNRRDRADRATSLSSSAAEVLIIPGLVTTTDVQETFKDQSSNNMPEASSLFADN